GRVEGELYHGLSVHRSRLRGGEVANATAEILVVHRNSGLGRVRARAAAPTRDEDGVTFQNESGIVPIVEVENLGIPALFPSQGHEGIVFAGIRVRGDVVVGGGVVNVPAELRIQGLDLGLLGI